MAAPSKGGNSYGDVQGGPDLGRLAGEVARVGRLDEEGGGVPVLEAGDARVWRAGQAGVEGAQHVGDGIWIAFRMPGRIVGEGVARVFQLDGAAGVSGREVDLL